MTERNYGAEVNGRSYWSQCREAYLLVLTHNLGALLFIELFYRAGINTLRYTLLALLETHNATL